MNNPMTVERFAEIMDTSIIAVIDLIAGSKVPTVNIDGFIRIPDISIDEAVQIQKYLSSN